ncbi:diaminobutyrate--2-oxoglutarate transaminase [Sphaerisporangium krabiense]|uniref:4-aminobutyrate aminotransferase-like enzyme n=1 Tax=Sphaerisporangium krabiense TaxID=763782 RepID=A0A7W8Z4C3_9ACTN|nr:aminotransferase class III-fold pyridoxal phosphate-dependent enzyme [Sphaerisporangium krabiense]MBB5627161.1 4-aminobutyrate aminotransferase-like enzyme [Sphaerisporangium krabiense]GII65319.1 diaminobutyrate--2-oxoglutarate transaminase [Sphaerisporangium krabiense]
MTAREIPGWIAAGDLVYRTPPEVRFARASGVRLYDEEDHEYVDAEAANGALALGYDRELLRDACERAMDLPALPSFCESGLRLRVLERLAGRFSRALGAPGRVAVELGGAQGIEMAMRVVAANRGGGTVLTFQGGYHGRSPFTAHLSASSRYRAAQPWPGPDVVRLPYPDCATCVHRPSGGGCNPACAAAIERLGTEDPFGVPPTGVAALVVEPLLNVGGFVLPDSGHLRRVVDHVRSLGGLIVVDEIFTGLHRLGPEWGFQLHGIEPDIVVAGKALTNGLTAFSCVWAREPLAAPEVFPPGSHSSTFAGNPLALAVVDAVLDRWDAPDTPARTVPALAARLEDALSPLAKRDLVRAVRVVGGVAVVELEGPHASRLRAIASRPRAGRPGLLLASTGMAPSAVALHPPLITAGEDVNLVAELLEQAIGELENGI